MNKKLFWVLFSSSLGFIFTLSSVALEQIWNGYSYIEARSPEVKGALDQINSYPFKGNENVLDIGSGNGEITSIIAHRTTGTVIGLDRDSSAVEYASNKYKKGNLKFRTGSAEAISNLEDFDLVVSFNTIQWIQNQLDLLGRINRALRPEGKILLSIPTLIQDEKEGTTLLIKVLRDLSQSAKWNPHLTNFRSPWRFFTKNDYERILTESNFNLKRIDISRKIFLFKNEEVFMGWMMQTLPQVRLIPPDLRVSFLRDVSQEYLKQVPLSKKGQIQLAHNQLEILATKIKVKSLQ